MINNPLLIRAKNAIPLATDQQDFLPLSYDVLANQLICFLGSRFSVLNIYLQMLAGIHKPYSGDVTHFVAQCSAHFPVIAYLNYNSTLLSVLPGVENVKLPALYHQLGSKEQIDLKVTALLAEMDYGADHTLLPAFMSGLQKRHLLIARAIMLDPKIVFIENPFAGLELAEATILGDYLATLVKNKQMTVITSNAHLDFVEHYAQQIIYAAADKFEFFSQWDSFLDYKQQHRLKF
jgi:NitT/TauT family transport system ATP-binding protein